MLTKTQPSKQASCRPRKPDPNANVQAEVSCTLWDMATHCARTPSRYAIAGVLVERRDGRLTLAATDGHRLAALERPDDGPPFACVVPLELLRQCAKPAPGASTAELTCWPHRQPHGRIALRHGSVAVEGEALDGSFPPYRDVIPDYDDGEKDGAGDPVIHVNPMYLADAAALAARFYRRHADGMSPTTAWRHRRANKPFVLESSLNGTDTAWRLRVVLMPLNAG